MSGDSHGTGKLRDECNAASVREPLSELKRLRLLARLVQRYGLNIGTERAEPPGKSLRYTVALDCGHKTYYTSNYQPATGAIARCDVCGEWRGVIVLTKEIGRA